MKREVYKYENIVFEKEKSIWKKIIPDSKKKNINKKDIGSPICFEHLAHTGLNNSFNISDNPMVAEILKEAGINNIHMTDKKTRQMVYSVIIDNMENIKKRKAKRKAPPPPTTPSCVPQRMSPKHNIAIPEPPPLENLPTIPMPPPPPLLNTVSIPAPPKIRNLSNEEENAIPAENDNRSALLESIRNGRKLKPVDINSTPKTSIDDTDRSNMIKILMDVLSKREKALQSSSDESNSEDDCEWDE
ncbi:PREDICTED: neural Wiskott-Aldrich syndrome protein-like [Nicrophorus vespilloides]|uniref:Neural Wiskott-Aldrich syndrome protein-like n=1 Tax=Nicrophorus vespilloides TaxID=110193 RepID=A0ABM1NJ12_NICVS|nr:PREDICTED: neural Wiskott-Aldrich syndrome protein-like [Nicrophorus vespilloides]